jgi:hypothetical protein
MSGAKFNAFGKIFDNKKKESKDTEEEEDEDPQQKAYNRKYCPSNKDRKREKRKKEKSESEEEEEEEEEETEIRKDSNFASSKRLKGSRILFPPIQNVFLGEDLDDIRKQQPPYVPRMTDDELQQVIDFEKQRMITKEKLNKDPYQKFINMVAGITHMAVSRLLNSPSGKEGGPSNVAFGGGGKTTLTSGISPISHGGDNPLLSPPRQRRNEQQPIFEPRFTESRENNTDLLQNFSKREIREKTEDYVVRARMFANLAWIERPDVLGITDMSPELYGNVRDAHSRITSRCEGLKSSTIEDFIEEDGQISEFFARLVSSLIKLNHFDSGTNSQFAKNRKNYETDVELAIRKLKNYSLNNGEFKESYTSNNYTSEYIYEPIVAGRWYSTGRTIY